MYKEYISVAEYPRKKSRAYIISKYKEIKEQLAHVRDTLYKVEELLEEVDAPKTKAEVEKVRRAVMELIGKVDNAIEWMKMRR